MATVQTLDYQVVDADNHYYEPLDLFERYIAPEFRIAPSACTTPTTATGS